MVLEDEIDEADELEELLSRRRTPDWARWAICFWYCSTSYMAEKER